MEYEGAGLDDGDGDGEEGVGAVRSLVQMD